MICKEIVLVNMVLPRWAWFVTPSLSHFPEERNLWKSKSKNAFLVYLFQTFQSDTALLLRSRLWQATSSFKTWISIKPMLWWWWNISNCPIITTVCITEANCWNCAAIIYCWVSQTNLFLKKNGTNLQHFVHSDGKQLHFSK